jgi:hypothetical protein
MGMVMAGAGDAAVHDDGMIPWSLMIRVLVRMMPFCKFPFQIPFGGEVSVSFCVSKCRISEPSSRGETI